MPGFDRTGPRGQGSQTGGGRGFCPPAAGAGTNGEPVVYGVGRGGMPRGGGRGLASGGGRQHRGHRGGRRMGAVQQPAPMSADQELSALNEQAQQMQDQLNRLTRRMTELTSEQTQS